MRIGVIGAGSWGTTLADLLASNGHDVIIWAREPEVVQSITSERVNRVFLPDCPLHEALCASGEIAKVVSGAELLVSAAPSHAVREVSKRVAEALGDASPLIASVSKGL